MLSAIVLASDARMQPAAPDAIVRTMAALVPAAIEGLVRDVTLAGLAGGELGHIADHAGCVLSESGDPAEVLREALAAARGQKLLVIRAGRAPEAGFIEEISDFLAGHVSRSHGAIMRDRPDSFVARAFPRLAPVAALVASRDILLKGGVGSLADLTRGLRPAVTLRARARRVD